MTRGPYGSVARSIQTLLDVGSLTGLTDGQLPGKVSGKEGRGSRGRSHGPGGNPRSDGLERLPAAFRPTRTPRRTPFRPPSCSWYEGLRDTAARYAGARAVRRGEAGRRPGQSSSGRRRLLSVPDSRPKSYFRARFVASRRACCSPRGVGPSTGRIRRRWCFATWKVGLMPRRRDYCNARPARSASACLGHVSCYGNA